MQQQENGTKKLRKGKKAALALLLAAVVLLILGVAASRVPALYRYTIDEAKAAAYRHFHIAEAEVSRVEAELDDGVYEIEFAANGTEYECDIHALTGFVYNTSVTQKSVP